MLKVWGRRNSFNVQKVMWLIGELDLPHEHIDAGGSFGLVNEPAFLAMNPHGRVPVIEDNGTAIWESHAILRYLAATYGAGHFWQADAVSRSQWDRWMDWSQASLHRDFLDLFWSFYRTPEPQRDWNLIKTHLKLTQEHYALLDRHLAGRRFMVGDTLSLADITIGATLYRYFELEIERSPLPHLEAWYASLCRRPAYRQHVMVPFGELRGRIVQ
ncbi:MAG TPA: glutathione S-transferase family protein [Dongiaceae bacterium]|nr:glutathione S-transferase family protein [Dongiaceae bacterium]